MKRNCFYLLTAFLLFSAAGAVQAQSTVKVTRTNGTVNSYTVQATGSISFAGDYVVIKETNTSSAQSIPMSAIRNMKFVDGSNSIDDVESATPVQIYPNPAQNYFVVRGIEGLQSVTVYSMTGARMIETTVEDEGRVDVSSLKTGVYMVKINNRTTKLVKW